MLKLVVVELLVVQDVVVLLVVFQVVVQDVDVL